jgi:AcrR family transcriptional regulator
LLSLVESGRAAHSTEGQPPERLIEAMVKLSAHGGYHDVTITDLCSHANVSAPTFYEHFASKEACFLAAYLLCGERIFGEARLLAVNAKSWREAARLALKQLLVGLERD